MKISQILKYDVERITDSIKHHLSVENLQVKNKAAKLKFWVQILKYLKIYHENHFFSRLKSDVCPLTKVLVTVIQTSTSPDSF